jgi:RimJ/RimL family protein N-acetyltransferase
VAEALPFPDPPLADTDFVLRPFREEDVAPDTEATEHESSARWLNTHTTGDAKKDVAMYEAERTAGRMLVLTIAGAEHDRYLGAIALMTRPDQAGELAYVVAPAARGRALARRALQLLGNWAFAELEMQRLQLRIDPENEASQAVARRAGYQREGVLRSANVVRGRRHDVMMYSRLPTDTPPGAAQDTELA